MRILTPAEIIERKKAYNKLIARHKKAVLYFDNVDVLCEEKEKFALEYEKVIICLAQAITEFRKNGVNMTSEEVLEGFMEVCNESI